jgi:hypothetical protein
MFAQILAQMRDAAAADRVYLNGDARNNDEIAVVAKLGYNQTTVIITVYRLRISDYDF